MEAHADLIVAHVMIVTSYWYVLVSRYQCHIILYYLIIYSLKYVCT